MDDVLWQTFVPLTTIYLSHQAFLGARDFGAVPMHYRSNGALLVLALLIGGNWLPADELMPQRPKRETTLDILLDDYQKYGLPLPPKEAKLIVNKSKNITIHDITWLRESGKMIPPIILQSIYLSTARRDFVPEGQLIIPDQEVESFDLEIGQALTVAVQCHAQGYSKIAGHLLKYCKQKNEN